MTKDIKKYGLAKFISTFAYIGNAKYCPGTFGSLGAFPISYLIAYIVSEQNIVFSKFASFNESQIVNLSLINIITALILLVLGTYYSSLYIKFTNKEDPKEIVIDEVVGQMLTNIMCFFSFIIISNSQLAKIWSAIFIEIVFLFALPFLLFRIFDILKPWPISWLDQNIKGGLGVMLDDILAAIFASVTHFVIVSCFLNIISAS